jgi:sorbitol/mannitol transport system permease protein
MWMLSTKMMPAVAVLIPIYLLFRDFGCSTPIGLIFALMLINLPIMVWMLYTYFKEIPGEILKRAHGRRSLWGEIVQVLTPMALPGIASTMLLNIILAWNEAFWTIVLTTTKAAPVGLHRQLLGAAGPVLRETLGGIGDGHHADPYRLAGSARSNSCAA